MGKHPILHYINEIKNKLGFGRTMTASGADVVDAVNGLSDQKANKDNLSTGIVTCATLNDIKTAFITKVNTMPDDSVSFIVINITDNVTEFAGSGRWNCQVNKHNNSYQTFSCEYNSGYNANRIYPVYVKNENGTWYFYSLTKQIEALGPYAGLDSNSNSMALSASMGKALANLISANVVYSESGDLRTYIANNYSGLLKLIYCTSAAGGKPGNNGGFVLSFYRGSSAWGRIIFFNATDVSTIHSSIYNPQTGIWESWTAI